MMKKRYAIYLVLCYASIIEASAQNTSLRFDGIDDKVSIPHDDAFNIGSGFTIEAWINANNWKSNVWAGSIVAKDGSGPDSGFAFRCGNNGSLSFVMSNQGSWFEVASAPVMDAKVWIHVAVVVSSGNISLLVNGNSVASGSFTGANLTNLLDLTIGESTGFPGRVFDGQIDEVRIWSVARSLQEIRDHYTLELVGDEEHLEAYYLMNEGAGTTLTNRAINSSVGNGTLGGFTNPWQPGFELPTNDVGVVSIASPDQINVFERPSTIKMTIKNFGFNHVSNVPLSYRINGMEAVDEVANVTLAPGESYTHTFSGLVNFTGSDEYVVHLTTGLDDDKNELNDELSVAYKKPAGSANRRIIAFDRMQHNFGLAGQQQFTTTIFPNDLSGYSKILLHIKVECPDGGCDPWDQPGKISAFSDNREVEIARFITPFGIGICGPWTVDVTDFKTLLQGETELRSYIQVWGASGWLLTAEFEFVESTDAPVFQKLSTLWSDDYVVYGDPSISHDLPEQSVLIDPTTSDAHIRLTVTGHGQANTDNAAEFSDKTHQLFVNNAVETSHRLWKPDCISNPCSPQNGTWTFARAGWCPGQGVEPFIKDISGSITPGGTVLVDYELEDYTNLLNTGYNGGSHTEPHYRIWGYLIEESSERFEDYSNLLASSLYLDADTTNNVVTIGALTLTLQNNGTTPVTNPTVKYYVNNEMISEETIDATIEAGDTIAYDFQTSAKYIGGKRHEIIAVLSSDADQNAEDDAISLVFGANLFKMREGAEILVYPNPSPDGMVRIEGLKRNESYKVKVYDTSGRLVGLWDLTGKEKFEINNRSGLYELMTIIGSGQVRSTYRLFNKD
ncbi:MAG: LamG-like jellyroll fold domain-containing protein [Bacteroidota bacterium]